MTTKQRLISFLAYLKISQGKFEKKVGLSTGFVNNVGDSICTASLDKIKSVYPELNTAWLLTGVGDMLDSEKNSLFLNSLRRKENEESFDKKDIEYTKGFTTYLLPMSAMGGTLTGFAAPGAMLQNCEAIISPIEDVDFAITVYGDSMAPEYPSGSRILIKKINPNIFIDWGKTYVLDTANGVIVKELHQCKGKEGYVKCHSVNPDPKFSDFDVPLSEVYGVYRVLMCMSAK